MNYTVRENQSIFDVCLQNFGTLESLFTILSENNINVNSNLSSGQNLVINNTLIGNEFMKKSIIKQNLTYVNQQLKTADLKGGDFNDDYDKNDYL
jgi:hypothetical protein